MKLQTKPLSIKILLLIFWQVFPCFLTAQISNLRFEKVEIPDETPLVSHVSIYEDSRGFMWFGGFTGLFMHDGNKLNTFVNNPKDSLSISDNKVVGICEDAKGNFWIGTQNGMNYFNFKKNTFIRYNNKIKHGLGVEPINVIKKDKNNNIWVSTNYGLFLFDSINQRFNKNSAQSDSSVVGRFAFFNKKVYFNSIAKNYTWNLKIKNIDSDSTETIKLPKPDNSILYLDEAGILWLSTRPGLYSINTSNINAPPTDYPLLKMKPSIQF